jgi:pimeloyl-ACP methyl ester carboxylesterase
MESLLILLAVLLAIIGFAIWLHRAFRVPTCSQMLTPESLGLNRKPLAVKAENGKRLDAWVLDPESVEYSDTMVIIVHGWGANKNVMLPLAKPFYERGMTVCMFDSRNHGASESDRFSSMPKFASDIEFVYHALERQYPDKMKSVFLLGHSLGAAAVLLAASRKLPLKGVISISAFAHPELAMKRFLHKFEKIPALIPLILSYVQWLIGARFDDIAPINTIQNVDSAVMIVHGDSDKTVPIDDGYLIFKSAKETHLNEIRFLEIEGADHDGVEKIEEHKSCLIDFILQHRNS